jgi:hypothetical protein
VHQHHPRAGGRDHAEHVRVCAGADVVHDIGAGAQRLARDGGLARIHRQEGLRRFAPEALQHRQHAAGLLVRADEIGARPGRLAADVEYVGAFFQEPEPVLHRGLGVLEHPAVAERIGRDVHDAHHERPLAERQLTIATAPHAVNRNAVHRHRW